MAKEKTKIISKLINLGAGIINAHDRLQIKADEAIKKAGDAVVNGMASVIYGYDLGILYIDRGCFIIKYHVANQIHKRRKNLIDHKKEILGYFAGGLLVAIAMVAVYNYATAYEYSYNGKVLGYVKNQEEVIKILDVTSEELTKEYGTKVNIDADTDIEFRRVVSVDKEIDNVDTVLRKFTYMSDMQSDGYGIYIDGKLYGVLKDKKSANAALDTIKNEFTAKKSQTTYEKVDFKENVKIKKASVKLAQIMSTEDVLASIKSGAQKETVYTVKSGDTYSGICETNDITMEQLKANNPGLDESSLAPGQEFIISKAASALTVVTVEKSTFAEVIPYETEYLESSSMYIGDSTVTQAGSDGKQVVTARITRENGVEIKRKVLESEVVTASVTEVITKGNQERPKTAPTGSFSSPIRSGYTLSSPFGYRWGRMHEGIDMACSTGTPIYAADGGTVTYAGVYGGYGNYIEITHGSGVTTRYGHCNSINVRTGTKVYKGEKIGTVGNTGRSTGSHLHFEIRIGGSPVNPFNYI